MGVWAELPPLGGRYSGKRRGVKHGQEQPGRDVNTVGVEAGFGLDGLVFRFSRARRGVTGFHSRVEIASRVGRGDDLIEINV